MKNEIIAYFRKHPTAVLKSRQLAGKLGIKKEHEKEKLKHFLFELFKEGVLVKDRKKYSLSRKTTGELTGIINIIDNGSYGFVVLDDSKLQDIFIAERYLGSAFSGDRVEVALFAKQRGKNIEGQVVKVLERKRTEFSGTLKKSKSFYFVKPDNREIHRDIYIAEQNLNKAESGDKVVVSEIEWDSSLLNPEGKITEVLGKAGSYDSEIASLAKEFNLTYKFPNEVLAEAEKIPVELAEAEIKRRTDLREEIIFTIDPDDAKDFDDAVSISKLENGNYSVGIHIADVSHYVRPGTQLYDEAYKRGTSVYFVGRVVPMLPERLSNKICSLVPNEDRLTYSVLTEITARGKVVSYKIEKTVINSKKRFSYEEAQNILEEGKGDFFDQLYQLDKLAKTLRNKRTRAGSINFSTKEVKFYLNEKGVPVDIKLKVIQDSNELIEEFMLLANQIVATHIDGNENNKSLPFVYRIHDLPDTEKLKEFATFVRSLGYSFDPNMANKSKQFQFLLDSVEGKEEESLINEVAIRSMAKAVYSPNNIGHYGLAFKYYSHFTSPIRRFPDLIVHTLLFNYNKNLGTQKFSLKKLEAMCEHCSAQERNAVSAERESVKIKQIEFLSEKLGEDFSGVISGVTNFGIFVKLNGNLAEGLIRLGDMDDDFYVYDEKTYTITGRSSGKKFRLGDKLEVKVVRVDVERRMINFMFS
ncbi:MAG: ribonuclease R [Melioribacteraceae bacterium]|nr:ribonuclease R [Melioribacteraceae bacterium]